MEEEGAGDSRVEVEWGRERDATGRTDHILYSYLTADPSDRQKLSAKIDCGSISTLNAVSGFCFFGEVDV